MVLAENIKDSFDEVMKTFVDSEEYAERHNRINEKISDLRKNLPDKEKASFLELVDLMGNETSDLASEALLRGAVHGMALHNEILG